MIHNTDEANIKEVCTHSSVAVPLDADVSQNEYWDNYTGKAIKKLYSFPIHKLQHLNRLINFIFGKHTEYILSPNI